MHALRNMTPKSGPHISRGNADFFRFTRQPYHTPVNNLVNLIELCGQLSGVTGGSSVSTRRVFSWAVIYALDMSNLRIFCDFC
jgi:hypothetical protein